MITSGTIAARGYNRILEFITRNFLQYSTKTSIIRHFVDSTAAWDDMMLYEHLYPQIWEEIGRISK
jgi:hypothetical protein